MTTVDTPSPKPDHRIDYRRAPYWLYPIAFAVVIVLGHLAGGWVDMDGDIDPASIDRHVQEWVARNRSAWPILTRLALMITQLGNPEVATTTVVVIAAAFLLLRTFGIGKIRKGEAFFWLVVAGGGRLLSMGLKLWFRRDRPPLAGRLVPESTFSFPSGHGMFAGVFFLLIAMVVVRESSGLPRRFRPVLIGLGLVIALSVAASRVWLGVHYVSDVVAGFLLGAFWAGAALLIRYGWGRWFPHRPQP